MNGDSRFLRFHKDKPDWQYKWTYITVNKILSDMVYLGDMENRKCEVSNYKTKKRVKVSKDNHIIVRNTHEALISRTDFDKVQALIKERDYPAYHNHENLFRSLLICGTCGKRMVLQVAKTKSGKHNIFYKCSRHYTHKDECPYPNTILYKNIKEIILSRLNTFFTALKNDSDFIDKLIAQSTDNSNFKVQEKEVVKIEKRLAILDKLTKKVYEDYISEIIDDKTYQRLIVSYQVETKELTNKLDILNLEKSKVNNYQEDINKIKVVTDEFLNTDKITNEIYFLG